MINLDAALARWQDTTSATGWAPDQAKAAAEAAASAQGLTVHWEPGDEEWLLLADERAYQAMVSINVPLALATPVTSAALRASDPALTVVEITDFLAEDIQATPELLRATVLPYGWADDFKPEAFCANDLFVESV